MSNNSFPLPDDLAALRDFAERRLTAPHTPAHEALIAIDDRLLHLSDADVDALFDAIEAAQMEREGRR